MVGGGRRVGEAGSDLLVCGCSVVAEGTICGGAEREEGGLEGGPGWSGSAQ